MLNGEGGREGAAAAVDATAAAAASASTPQMLPGASAFELEEIKQCNPRGR